MNCPDVPDYSSDSSFVEYYLCTEETKQKSAPRCCEVINLSSDPVDRQNLLQEAKASSSGSKLETENKNLDGRDRFYQKLKIYLEREEKMKREREAENLKFQKLIKKQEMEDKKKRKRDDGKHFQRSKRSLTCRKKRASPDKLAIPAYTENCHTSKTSTPDESLDVVLENNINGHLHFPHITAVDSIEKQPHSVIAGRSESVKETLDIVLENNINGQLPDSPAMDGIEEQDPPVIAGSTEHVEEEEEEGDDDLAVLVIEKELYSTDANDHHHRLSIPVKQLQNQFLKEHELRMFDQFPNAKISAKLIDPSNAIHKIQLGMHRLGAKGKSRSYTIGKPWNKIRHDNFMVKGTKIQLWAFRQNSTLYFNLTKV